MSRAEQQYDERYLEYIKLFNQRDFYDCHEVLEDLWLDDPGENRTFYQGLIQFATAFQHLFRGNIRGFERLLASAKGYLARFPSQYEGLNLEEIRAVIDYWQQKLQSRRADEPLAYDDSHVPLLRLQAR